VSPALFPVAVLAAALAIDLAVGDPPNRWHPVAWLGGVIATARRRLAHGPPRRLLVNGAIVTIGIAGLAAVAGLLVARVAAEVGIAGLVLEAAALSCCLSVRGLWQAAAEVAAHLDAGDVPGARVALAWHLVSRPTAELGPGEIAAAAVESVAENLTDSIVAPALMYLAFGLPGATVYRAVNTADAMLGYREGALEHFGKVAARADDLLSLIPARVAAFAIVVAAALMHAAPAQALRILWRDRRKTSSPNAGWTMAAMAGALGVRLAKRDAYVLGDGPLPAAQDIRRSFALMSVAAALALAVAAMIALGLRDKSLN
jgi:adenosylcobinamide-phosphate synthase